MCSCGYCKHRDHCGCIACWFRSESDEDRWFARDGDAESDAQEGEGDEQAENGGEDGMVEEEEE
jgi:hypothetical protein